MPDSKVEVKACPEKMRSTLETIKDILQKSGMPDKDYLIVKDLIDIALRSRSPIANNGVSFDSIVDKLTHLNGDHLMGLELNNIHIIANFITRLPTTAPRGGQ